ncbi:hypothetical protein [Micromonospora aurantiaca (nom. illeg.)]|uniref:hypothetical protein n=1 Tax=Micromonospora aurantiaca (nom. illeg.) TaxID=47850 RepID=UPI003EBF514F
MLTESLLALAATGGSAIAGAMATDAWNAVKSAVVRVMNRDAATTESELDHRLENSALALDGLSGPQLTAARAAQEVLWRARLEDFLARYPESANDLERALANVSPQAFSSVQQQIIGYGNAQQAAQGHGVQNVNFGRPEA